MEKEELSWCPAEVERRTAVNTVHTLQDALWATDGHHHTLAERACKILEVFHSFTGYNQPELSKHWKQQVESLSADTLQSHSHQLFGNLQSRYWDCSAWVGLKAEVELLAKSLGMLTSYLSNDLWWLLLTNHIAWKTMYYYPSSAFYLSVYTIQ